MAACDNSQSSGDEDEFDDQRAMSVLANKIKNKLSHNKLPRTSVSSDEEEDSTEKIGESGSKTSESVEPVPRKELNEPIDAASRSDEVPLQADVVEEAAATTPLIASKGSVSSATSQDKTDPTQKQMPEQRECHKSGSCEKAMSEVDTAPLPMKESQKNELDTASRGDVTEEKVMAEVDQAPFSVKESQKNEVDAVCRDDVTEEKVIADVDAAPLSEIESEKSDVDIEFCDDVMAVDTSPRKTKAKKIEVFEDDDFEIEVDEPLVNVSFAGDAKAPKSNDNAAAAEATAAADSDFDFEE